MSNVDIKKLNKIVDRVLGDVKIKSQASTFSEHNKKTEKKRREVIRDTNKV